MPKGYKRSAEDYEREAINAIKRFKQKYGDSVLENARNSKDWIKFLKSIGIETSGADFWDNVQEKALKEIGEKEERHFIGGGDKPIKRKKKREVLPTLPSSVVKDYGASVARFARQGKIQIAYRDINTGKFRARKDVGG